MVEADAVIISDLHLGSPTCQARQLNHFLTEIVAGQRPTQRLILNGDVFDSIDFRRLKDSHWRVLSLLRKLSDSLEVVWVCGNHDGSAEVISHLLGVTFVDEYVVASGGRNVLFLHGHQFDRIIEKYPTATWLADTVYRMIQRVDPSHRVAKLAKRKSKTFLRCAQQIEAGAVARAAELGCDVVCCGHTHLSVGGVGEAVRYFNGGCWTEKPCHYLTLTAGVVQLHGYDESVAETLLELPTLTPSVPVPHLRKVHPVPPPASSRR